MERRRELHGGLKIYLRAEAVNISTTELQMTKEFLESRPPDPPRWKRAVGGKSGSASTFWGFLCGNVTQKGPNNRPDLD